MLLLAARCLSADGDALQRENVLLRPLAQRLGATEAGELRRPPSRAARPRPRYGFGDPTSYSLIEGVVATTAGCGAVRHGAECFNFYFPQELDDAFLIALPGYDEAGATASKPPGRRARRSPPSSRSRG